MSCESGADCAECAADSGVSGDAAVCWLDGDGAASVDDSFGDSADSRDESYSAVKESDV